MKMLHLKVIAIKPIDCWQFRFFCFIISRNNWINSHVIKILYFIIGICLILFVVDLMVKYGLFLSNQNVFQDVKKHL